MLNISGKIDHFNKNIYLAGTTAILLVISVFISGCGGGSSGDSASTGITPSIPYSYQQPALKNDGWQTAHLDEFEIDNAPLLSMMQQINQESDGYRFIDHVLIVKDNHIVFDERLRTELDIADGWANNTDINLHILNSVTKSVNSALIGIAIDKGYIENVNVKVHDFFQHKQPIANWTEEKSNITIKNWLNMRHGYLWDEWNVSYLDSNNLNSQMNNADDPIQFLLDRPMETNPGETFAYSTGVSFGLGRILSLATGQSVSSFMEQNLFSPLGIEKYDYWSLDGQLHTGSALYLNARDMAKFGQLYLNNGLWNGEQVISSQWIEESTQKYVDNGTWSYGYQWWMTTFYPAGEQIETFYADGFGGQYIFVLPQLNAVVVFNGRAYQTGQSEQYNIRKVMEEHILPALL